MVDDGVFLKLYLNNFKNTCQDAGLHLKEFEFVLCMPFTLKSWRSSQLARMSKRAGGGNATVTRGLCDG